MNIFSPTDPKLTIIKQCLKNHLLSKMEEGLEWVITSGQLGTELWASEVAIQLREEGYALKVGLLLPFTDYGEKWKEPNKQVLDKIKTEADFTEYSSKQTYFSPRQFQANQEFIIRNTDCCLLMYDPEYEGKASYLLERIKQIQENRAYSCDMISFDTLEETAREEAEKKQEYF